MNDHLEMERVCADLVLRNKAKAELPHYIALTTDQVSTTLVGFFAKERPNSTVSDVARAGGGAAMEQFFFDLVDENGRPEKMVLRLEPVSGITVTDRRREMEILHAVGEALPVPKPLWFDETGEMFGRPGMIVNFFEGVTKDSESQAKCTGLGTSVGDRLRPVIRQQFMDYFVKLHAIDWRKKELPSFDVADGDPKQVARWHVNYWQAMWEMDKVEDRPMISYAFQWLHENLPDCDELVLVHNDYRTGNYLFDEQTGDITAVLDWEYACIGDYHEDVSYSLSPVFATTHDGALMFSDLYEREEFITAYESASGRTINRKTLHFYDVLTALKTYVVATAHSLSAVRRKQNHQDVLLTFVSSTNVIFVNELQRLLFEEND